MQSTSKYYAINRRVQLVYWQKIRDIMSVALAALTVDIDNGLIKFLQYNYRASREDFEF
jgi:hypothetical protein